jgi:hypothetical protein
LALLPTHHIFEATTATLRFGHNPFAGCVLSKTPNTHFRFVNAVVTHLYPSRYLLCSDKRTHQASDESARNAQKMS